MEVDKKYLNAELLNVFLFSTGRLIIKNYCDVDKFKPLLSILTPYDVEYKNLEEIWNPKTLETYLSAEVNFNYQSGKEKRILYVFTNPKPELLQIVMEQKDSKFLVISSGEFNNSRDFNVLDHKNNLIFYSTKTTEFSKDFEGIDLTFEKYLISEIRKNMDKNIDLGIIQARLIVDEIFSFSKSIFTSFIKEDNDSIKKLVANFSKGKIKSILKYAEQFIESYYLIKLKIGPENVYLDDEISKKKILNKKKTEKLHDNKSDVKNKGLNNKKSYKIFSEIESEEINIDEGSKIEQINELYPILKENISDLEKERIELMESVRVIESEFAEISSIDKNLLKCFNQLLFNYKNLIKNSCISENPVTPKQIYTELRISDWEKEIPVDFIKKWFLLHLKKTFKIQKSELNINDSNLFEKELSWFYTTIKNNLANNIPMNIIDLEILSRKISKKNSKKRIINGKHSEKKVIEKLPLDPTTTKNPVRISLKSVNNNTKEFIDSSLRYISMCIEKNEIPDFRNFKKSVGNLIKFIKN